MPTAAETDDTIELVDERGQKRPRDWQKTPGVPAMRDRRHLPLITTQWVKVANVDEVPAEGGIAIKYGPAQIALYNFASRGEWYACQNQCPHMSDMVLARGLIGDEKGQPKVACPQHKKTFSLEDGECLSGDQLKVRTFPVRIEDVGVPRAARPAYDEAPDRPDRRRGFGRGEEIASRGNGSPRDDLASPRRAPWLLGPTSVCDENWELGRGVGTFAAGERRGATRVAIVLGCSVLAASIAPLSLRCAVRSARRGSSAQRDAVRRRLQRFQPSTFNPLDQRRRGR